MKRPISIFAALTCAAFISGCATFLDVGDVPTEVHELRHLSVCNSASGEAAVTVLPDLAAVRSWQASRGIDLTGDGPLPEGPYAVVEHGARGTGGYAVVVGRQAVLRHGLLLIQASFLAPIGGNLMPEALTSPCALTQLPVANYDTILLVDPRGRRRALSAEPPRPTPAGSPPAQ